MGKTPRCAAQFARDTNLRAASTVLRGYERDGQAVNSGQALLQIVGRAVGEYVSYPRTAGGVL